MSPRKIWNKAKIIFEGLLPERPGTKYLSKDSCDLLEQLYVIADYVVVLASALKSHPETTRVKEYALRHDIPYEEITGTAQFCAVRNSLEKIANLPFVSPEATQTSLPWRQAHAVLFDAVENFVLLVSNEKKSEPLYAVYEAIQSTCPYQGPNIRNEITSLCDKYQEVRDSLNVSSASRTFNTGHPANRHL